MSDKATKKKQIKPKNGTLKKATLLVVLDPPNASEVRSGQTAAGNLGEVLDWLFDRLGLKGDYVAINAMPYRTDDKPTIEQLTAEGRPFVQKMVKKYRPDAVLSMGSAAHIATQLADVQKDQAVMGKVVEVDGIGYVGATMSAWTLFGAPVKSTSILFTINKLLDWAEHGGMPEPPALAISVLRTAQDVKTFHKILRKESDDNNGLRLEVSYDHETSSLEPHTAHIGTMSFYWGATRKEKPFVVVWDGFGGDISRLKTPDPDATEAWREFFADLPNFATVIGANSVSFDDQVVRARFGFAQRGDPGGWDGSDWDTMIASWQLDNSTPNGLKSDAAAWVGLYDYDGDLGTVVEAVAERRKKIPSMTRRKLSRLEYDADTPPTEEDFGPPPVELIHEQDRQLLELANRTLTPQPYRLKSGQWAVAWHWPDTLDRKYGAFLLAPIKDLIRYNAYDAYATYELYKIQHAALMEEGCSLYPPFLKRMNYARLLAEMEHWGLHADDDLLNKQQELLEKIEQKAFAFIFRQLQKRKAKWTENDDPFNPQSDAQVRRILYGKPMLGYRLDMGRTVEGVMSARPNYNRFEIWKDIELWVASFYRQFENRELTIETVSLELSDAITEVNDKAAKPLTPAQAKTKAAANLLKPLKKKFVQSFLDEFGITPSVQVSTLYFGHFSNPDQMMPRFFTKTGLPSLKAEVLQGVYAQTKDQFIKYLLIWRRARKLNGTFVDGIRQHLRAGGILYPSYNSTGTNTGRISSCVRQGTLIETPYGLKSIETLKAGDHVLDCSGTPQPLLRDAFQKPDARFYRITLATGQSFECTGAHRLLCEDKIWRCVSELSEHSEIMSYSVENVHPSDYSPRSQRSGCAQPSQQVCRTDVGGSRGRLFSSRFSRVADTHPNGRSISSCLSDLHVLLSPPATRVGLGGKKALPVCANQVRQHERGEVAHDLVGQGSTRTTTRVLHGADCRETGDNRMVCTAFNANSRNCEHTAACTMPGLGLGRSPLFGAVCSRPDRSRPLLLRTAWRFLRVDERGLVGTSSPRVLFEGVQGLVRLSLRKGPHCTAPAGAMGGEKARVSVGTSPQGCPHPDNPTVLSSEILVRLSHRQHPDSRGMRWRISPDRREDEVKGCSKDASGGSVRVSNPPFPKHSDSLRRGERGVGDTTRIVQIEALDIDTPWDITVANTHSYRACGAVHHNSSPNAQNWPENLRGFIVPRDPEWIMVSGDLSQAEVRVMAALSDDPALKEALKHEDIHVSVAAMIYHVAIEEVTKEMRRNGKTANFGVLYGLSAIAFSVMLGCTVDEAQELIDTYLARFKSLKRWMDAQKSKAAKSPYYVETLFGTRRSTLDILSFDKGSAGKAARVAVNMPVQGTAGELTLWFGVEIMRRVRENGWHGLVRPINTVHDSLTFEVHPSLVNVDWENPANCTGPFPALFKEVVESPVPFPPLDTVDFKVDIEAGRSWYNSPDAAKAAFSPLKEFGWGDLDITRMGDDEQKQLEAYESMYQEHRMTKKGSK